MTEPASKPVSEDEAIMICGAFAKSFIAREGSYFPCVLEKGHVDAHRNGGTCYRHGAYVGDCCPHWPTCIKSAVNNEERQEKIRLVEEEIREVDHAIRQVRYTRDIWMRILAREEAALAELKKGLR